MTNGKKIIIGIVLIIISYFFGFTAKGTEILRNNFNISLSNIIGLGFLFIGLILYSIKKL